MLLSANNWNAFTQKSISTVKMYPIQFIYKEK